MRIQKILAHSGVGSRRNIETMIAAGLVKVNGIQAKLGQLLQGDEHVTVKGKKVKLIIPADESAKLIMLNKPVGWLCSHHPQTEHPSVFSLLPPLKQGRWVAVGRLDLNSSGLLLFTNNGKLADLLMHPRSNLTRVYNVRVLGTLSEAQRHQLTNGVRVDGELAKLKFIEPLSTDKANVRYQVGITQGKNRIVRKLFASQDCQVNRLRRVAHGPFKLPDQLPGGKCMEISQGIWRLKLASLLKKVTL